MWCFRKKQATPDRSIRVDLPQNSAVSRHLRDINRWHLIGFDGGWALCLIVDDKNLMIGNQKSVYLPGNGKDAFRFGLRFCVWTLQKPSNRDFGTATGAENRTEFRMVKNRHHFSGNFSPFRFGKIVSGKCQKARSRCRTVRQGNVGEGLQQAVNQNAALKTGRLPCTRG